MDTTDSYYITGKTLFDGTGKDPESEVIIEIRNGFIRQVAQRSQFSFAGVDASHIIDYSEFYLLPGLIDGHVHLCLDAGNSHDSVVKNMLEEYEQGTLYSRLLRNYYLLLKGGVTTVRDLGGPGFGTVWLRNAVEKGILFGPRLLTAGMPVTTPKGHLHYLGLPADSREDIETALNKLWNANVDVLKICVTGGILTPESNPYMVQFASDDLRYMVEEAHARKKLVAAHVLCTDGILQAVESGIDTIEHCVWKNEDGFDFDEEVAQCLQESPARIHATFTGADRELLIKEDHDEEDFQLNIESLQEKYQFHRAMFNRGTPVICTSDAGVRWTRFDEFWRSLAAMTVALQVSPEQALLAATGEAAKSIGLETVTGTIEEGKAADILVLTEDPLSDISNLQHMHSIICRGRIIDPAAMANLL